MICFVDADLYIYIYFMIFRNFFGQEAMQSFASAFKPAVEEKGFRCDVVMEIEDSPEREPHLAKHFPEDMEVEKTDGEKEEEQQLESGMPGSGGETTPPPKRTIQSPHSQAKVTPPAPLAEITGETKETFKHWSYQIGGRYFSSAVRVEEPSEPWWDDSDFGDSPAPTEVDSDQENPCMGLAAGSHKFSDAEEESDEERMAEEESAKEPLAEEKEASAEEESEKEPLAEEKEPLAEEESAKEPLAEEEEPLAADSKEALPEDSFMEPVTFDGYESLPMEVEQQADVFFPFACSTHSHFKPFSCVFSPFP